MIIINLGGRLKYRETKILENNNTKLWKGHECFKLLYERRKKKSHLKLK